MRKAAVAFVVAGFGAVLACGNDLLPAAGDPAVPTSDAAAPSASEPAPQPVAATTDAGPELITGDAAFVDADADADADAGTLRVDPPADAGPGTPCPSFYEEWNLDDGGAWLEATNWTVTGTGLDIRYLPIHGGYFATNTGTSLAQALLPSCHYAISLPIIPPTPFPADLTFVRITNTDPSATVTFALTSSTDDAGVVHGFISIRFGGEEVIKNEVTAGQLTGIGLTYTKRGSLLIGNDDNPGGEFFFGPDAAPVPGFDKIEVGVVAGPTATAESLYFGVVSTEWNDTL